MQDPSSIAQLVSMSSDRFGSDDCIIDGALCLSFAEVNVIAKRVAFRLALSGVGKGDHVAILAGNRAEWVLSFLALAKLGAVAIPLSTMSKPPELRRLLAHTDVSAIILTNSYATVNLAQLMTATLPELQEKPGRFFASLPHLRQFFVWGDNASAPWATSLSVKGSDAIQPQDDFFRDLEASMTFADDAVIICTSGTTSDPKAVIHTNGSCLRSSLAVTPCTGLARGDRTLALLPFFWVGGLSLHVMGALHAGAALVCASSPAHVDILAAMRAGGVNHVVGSPMQIEDLKRDAGDDACEFRSLKGWWTPGGLTPDGGVVPADRRQGAVGMTEVFGLHHSAPNGFAIPHGKQGAHGVAIGGVEARVVDMESGIICQQGEVGELHLRGATLMRGYYKRERHFTFDEDGYFHTGDSVAIDGDGYLYFYGRTSELIKTSGANVSPAEVERELYGFPGVSDAAVFGVADEVRGETVVAVIVTVEPIDAILLRQHLLERLSNYKVPRRFFAVDGASVQRTATGKIIKHTLKDMLERSGVLREPHDRSAPIIETIASEKIGSSYEA
ncbi:MAG: class I adenylate-forming enzyme family protein [Caulobacterales bacterium]